MKDLYKLIEEAKNENEEVMIELIEIFNPIINKYTRMMNYDEDFKSNMMLKFIKMIKKELDFKKFYNINDYIIIKYIEMTMYHHYILLSKANRKINVFEASYENEIIYNISDSKELLKDNNMDNILLEIIKTKLTSKEYTCIDLIIFQGYTSIDVAKKLGITKQAVNQCKHRALNKIKGIII